MTTGADRSVTAHPPADAVEPAPGNPFPGFRAFEEADADVFFGRVAQVDELVQSLARSRFVAVVGMSASGKSSLVRAGLIPKVRSGAVERLLRRSEPDRKRERRAWRIVTMRPGDAPIANLATALQDAGFAPSGLSSRASAAAIRSTLEAGELGLVQVVKAGAGADDSVLIVVDQFEELFRFRRLTQTAPDNLSESFVKLLLAASDFADARIYVLITMRADFFGDCAIFRGLPEKVQAGLFLVPRLSLANLRQAIEGPVTVAGAAIAPTLVNRLLNELADDQDQLPVLQHALMRTWEIWATKYRADGDIVERHYNETGGLAEALPKHIQEVWDCDALRVGRRRFIVEKLFKALTENDRETRRGATIEEVAAIAEAPIDEVIAAADTFRGPDRAFLTPPADRNLDTTSILDITHESLIRKWKRLKKWAEEEAESAQSYRRLTDAAEQYRKKKSGLLTDPALSVTDEWRQKNRPNPAWAERYSGETRDNQFELAMDFLTRSLVKRLVGRLKIGALCGVVIALVFVFINWQAAQTQEAIARARIADSFVLSQMVPRQLPRQSTNLRDADLLAAAAYQTADTPHAREALFEAISASGPGVAHIALPPWKKAVITGKTSLAVVLRPSRVNATGGLVVLDTNTPALNIRSAALNGFPLAGDLICGFPDSDEIAAIHREASTPGVAGHDVVKLVDLSKTAPTDLQSLNISPVTALACLRNSVVLVARSDGRIEKLNLLGSEPSQVVGAVSGARISGMLVSPSGAFVATISTAGHARQLDVFDIDHHRNVASRKLGDVGMDCTYYGCSSIAAFAPTVAGSPQRVAWYSDGFVRVTTVGGRGSDEAIRCPRSVCRYVTLMYSGSPSPYPHVISVLPPKPSRNAGAGNFQELPAGRELYYDRRLKAYGTLAVFQVGSVSSLPIYDHTRDVIISNDGGPPNDADTSPNAPPAGAAPVIEPPHVGSSGGADETYNVLAIHYINAARPPLSDMERLARSGGEEAIIEANGPLTGEGRAPSSYAFVNDSIVIPSAGKPFARTPLSAWHLDPETKSAGDPPLVMRDSGDGIHAVMIDAAGQVTVIDMKANTAQPIPTLTLSEPERRNAAAGLVEIAYDPLQRTITLKTRRAIDRYDINGRRYADIPLNSLKQRVGAADGDRMTYRLSARGNYIIVDDGRHDKQLMRTDGRQINDTLALLRTVTLKNMADRYKALTHPAFTVTGFYAISDDEHEVLARSTSDYPKNGVLAISSLQTLDPVEPTAIPLWAQHVAFSSDGRWVAYSDAANEQHPSQGQRQQVVLYVRGANGLSLRLTDPPLASSIERISIGADNAHLVVEFVAPPKNDHFLAVYSIDPKEWQRSACLAAGKRLRDKVGEKRSPAEQLEIGKLMGDVDYQPGECDVSDAW